MSSVARIQFKSPREIRNVPSPAFEIYDLLTKFTAKQFCADPDDSRLSATLIRALVYLAGQREGTATVNDLSQGARVSLGWASRIADQLFEQGLLSRSRDEADRRLVRLQLTPQAVAIVNELRAKMAGKLAQVCKDLAPHEQAIVVRFLRQLVS